jgi:hypothetical protein
LTLSGEHSPSGGAALAAASHLMRGIFLSYRRDDSAGYAGRLFDFLRERLGEDRVFMDVTDIAPGSDFVQTLARGLHEADAVLVLIGPRWAGASTVEGRLRLWEPDDFVRKEVVTALASGRRVVPVLVQGAAMPRAEQLPGDLQGLLTRQAVALSDTRWQRDCEDLLQDLYPRAAVAAPSGAAPTRPAARSAQWKGLLAGIVLLAALAGGIVAERAGLVPFTLPWSQARVPNVIGLQRAEAEQKLKAAGFQLAEPALARESREPRGTVIGQQPAGGERDRRGSTVRLTLAARPAETLIEVPNMALYTVEEARSALARRGLRLGRVDARSGAARPGLVLEQSAAPFTKLPAGAVVNIVVAAAPAAPVAPPGAPAQQTVEALCGKRVLLAYQRCVQRECAKPAHAADPLCREAPATPTSGN